VWRHGRRVAPASPAPHPASRPRPRSRPRACEPIGRLEPRGSPGPPAGWRRPGAAEPNEQRSPPARSSPTRPRRATEVAMKQYGMTVLRVAVGAVYVMQAYLALFDSSPLGVASFIAKLGLPAPTLVAARLIVVHGS